MATRDLDERRIEEAREELGRTALRRSVGVALVVGFLALLAAVPLAEVVGPREPLPALSAASLGCSLRSLEKRLDEGSRLGRALRPYVQTALLWAGAGDAPVYVGRDGWLFQREAVASVTGRSFLAADVQRRRRVDADRCGSTPHPDPFAAVLAFQEALAQRGVRLLVLPTPAKASIEPARFSARFSGEVAGPRNTGFADFVAGLRRRGVWVVDPAPALRDGSGAPSYLASDTHWRPEAVERVAALLAEEITHGVALSPPTLALRRERALVTNRGDVAALLGALPGAVPLERVAVHRVVAASGEPWRADPRAEILLLGDSFSNVYSDRAAFARENGRLDWGAGAGLAEQISFALQRPVDRIVQNDDGAFATRLALARAGRDRLAGVRVVVWQFAERELAFGDWRPVDLTPPPARETPPPAGRRTVRARIAARAPLAPAGSTPYPDALFAVHLVDVETLAGPPAPAELVAYLVGRRDNRPSAAASEPVGARLTLTLSTWDDADVQARYGGLARTELDEPDALGLPAFFGEPLR